MKAIDLNGTWRMRRADAQEEMEARIPGSVASVLLENEKIDDPFYRDNEAKAQDLFEADYEFSRVFNVTTGVLMHDRVVLKCEGLDTVASITLNGQHIADTDNMHRTYTFDVKGILAEGENRIAIRFSSPVRYLKEHPSKTGRKFAPLRKAACMFGWDWGLSLPDSGIWRDISIETYDCAHISHIHVKQSHHNGVVDLDVTLCADVWEDGVEAFAELMTPGGAVIFCKRQAARLGTSFHIRVKEPLLWWPVGYGGQPLYALKVSLDRNGKTLDERTRQLGLRTVVLNRDKRQDGSNFGFVVNGAPVFFKGENLVIEDAIVSRTTNERWDRLLLNCLRSNLNGIRVWGGAYYPPDYFYEQCDRLGLLVWQDLMFACTFYMPTDAFVENVRQELADNLSRIAHHPCLALLCGNNEVESIYTVMCSKEPETVALRKLFGSEKRAGLMMRTIVWRIYQKLFLKVIPPLCAQYAPEAGYVHSSPSTRKPRAAKSFFDYLTDGDMHYYLQYNGNAPYQKMRTVKCRFMTEMGFQSYPSMKTIAAFADESERTPYSPVMYAHQKCHNGNETIELYMRRDYLVPENFFDYVYLSQLQAGEIMKYSVEHLRRQSGYCNGVILWQLNDCWPVVSWSGIDYFGRWKAQQYYTKRFFSPVLVSALDEGARVELWVTNNATDGFDGTLKWKLADHSGAVRDEGEQKVSVPPGSSGAYAALDYSGSLTAEEKRNLHFEYSLFEEKEECAGQGTVLFCLAKEFAFEKPQFTLKAEQADGGFRIRVKSTCFAKGVALDTAEGDCVFSDNFFDLAAGEERTTLVAKGDLTGITGAEELEKQLRVTCLNTVMLCNRNVQ